MISNDVNVIFAYLDRQNKQHKAVKILVKKNKRRKYVLLAQVYKTFLYTYGRIIKLVGVLITSEVLQYRKKNENSTRNKDKEFILRMLETSIEKKIREHVKSSEYNQETLSKFKDYLLKNYSLIELYEETEKIGRFREKFIHDSQEHSIDSLNTFFTEFKNKKLMKLSAYKNYQKQLSKISFIKDYEDRKIATEIICFLRQHSVLRFLTFDKTFKTKLKRLQQDKDLTLHLNW